MTKHINKIIALALCMALMFSLTMPAYAANETNTKGVVFTAVLDTPELMFSDADQTVNMTIKTNQPIDIDGIGLTFTSSDSTIKATKVVGGPEVTGFANGDFTAASGVVTWSYDYSDGDNTTVASDLLVATYVIPAGTPAGEYTLTAKDIELSADFGENWESGASASATLTITAPEAPTPTTAYTADLSSTASAVKVGQTVTVDVKVGGANKEFASSQLSLSYEGLTYVNDTATVADERVDITGANGSIKIIDHGDSLTWAENASATAYTFTFTVDAIDGATGTANVTLSNAKFSTDENALSQNLTPAENTPVTKEFTVTPADLRVTLDSDLSGNNSVVYGGTYTFEAVDKNYNYTVTVNGQENVAVVTGDGTWKIENVSEALNIQVKTKNAKTHTVTYSNAEHIDGTLVTTATYNQPYSFTLKANVAADTSNGVTYNVDSIVYTGTTTAVPYTQNGQTITIEGSKITAPITITTSETSVEANQFVVDIEGDSGVTANKNVVNKGEDVVLTLTPEAGYDYTVTVNDQEVTEWIDGENGTKTFTVENVQAKVTVTVTKTIDTDCITDVAVYDYLALSGKTIYLVVVQGNFVEGFAPTYDGNVMYKSAKYNGYAYLVLRDANDALLKNNAKTMVSVVTATSVTEIDYSGNVNMADSSTVDANDAQLVYNMYQTEAYKTIEAAGMEKFLRADVKGDKNVDTHDAALIVSYIKGTATPNN